VLINLLIAMMSSTYGRIDKNATAQWQVSSSSYYMHRQERNRSVAGTHSQQQRNINDTDDTLLI
jgi:hypothetical protein